VGSKGDSVFQRLKKVFPIYWVSQRVGRWDCLTSPSGNCGSSFQFIGFPSEWGANTQGPSPVYGRVSNLLGSPASGEGPWITSAKRFSQSFQFIGFPSEWGAPHGRSPCGE